MGNPEVLIERVIFQGTITFVWSLSMANVVLKIMRVKKETASLGDELIPAGMFGD